MSTRPIKIIHIFEPVITQQRNIEDFRGRGGGGGGGWGVGFMVYEIAVPCENFL